MTDIIVKPGDYDGKNIQLTQPLQVIKAAPGYDVVRLNSTVEILASAAGAQIDRSLALVRDPRHTLGGMVQSHADNAGVHCELDLQGQPFQGLQLLDGCKTPNIDWLWVHDVGLGVVPAGGTPQYHGVYAQNTVGLTGTNLRFDRCEGYGMQFYPSCFDAKVSQITCDSVYGPVVFWGSSARNSVTKLLAVNTGAGGVVTQYNATLNPKVDYVTAPTPGYGYQPVAPTPSPAADVAAAVVALKLTTLSGAAMVNRYGTDVSKWPAGHWHDALVELGVL